MKQVLLYMTLLLWCCCGVAACLSETSGIELISVQVEPGPYEISIPAIGELRAVTSTGIKIPPSVRGRQTIAWICSENSKVREGDVLIRFDDSDHRRKVDDEQYQITLIDLAILEKRLDIEIRKKKLTEELRLVTLEKEMAETFAPRDEKLFSRNEIIEATMNIDYLTESREHLDRKLAKFEQKTEAELQILLLRRKTHQVRMDQYNEALKMLEVKAPHEGVFVYERLWRGDKPRVGQNVWSGLVLGRLPDLSQMEVKAYVQEAEAGGLSEGLEASIVLDAVPGKTFMGKVKRVDALAKQLDEEKPVNYFEVIISLDTTNPVSMKPGGQVRTEIFVEKLDQVIAIPNQAIFSQGEKTYVFRKQNETFHKTEVETGARSLSRTVITAGLEAHDEIALSRPDGEE